MRLLVNVTLIPRLQHSAMQLKEYQTSLAVNVMLVPNLQHSATTQKDHRMRLLVNVTLVPEIPAFSMQLKEDQTSLAVNVDTSTTPAFCDATQGIPNQPGGQCDTVIQ